MRIEWGGWMSLGWSRVAAVVLVAGLVWGCGEQAPPGAEVGDPVSAEQAAAKRIAGVLADESLTPEEAAALLRAGLAWSGDHLDQDLVEELAGAVSEHGDGMRFIALAVIGGPEGSAEERLEAALDDAPEGWLARSDPRRMAEPVEELLQRCGEAWPEYLLAAVVRQRTRPEEFVASFHRKVNDDRIFQPAARLLARPAGALDRPLAALLGDPHTPEGLWRACLTFACRPESADLLPLLTDLALDTRLSPRRRDGILYRLHRFEQPVPDRIRTLLHLPFGGLDRIAATLLAVQGRPEAMSLVRELASHAGPMADDKVTFVAQALRALAPDDPEIEALEARALTQFAGYIQGSRPTNEEQWETIKALRTALDDLIEQHPEWMETPFEVERRGHQERAEALAAGSRPELVLLARRTDDELDFGLRIWEVPSRSWAYPEAVERHIVNGLERMERLVAQLDRDLGGARDRASVLAVLRQRLHGPRESLSHIGAHGLAHELDEVLHIHCGTCLGNASLWIAVAERLELPIRAVQLPTHVALLWDDGETQVLLEPTERAEARTIDHYRRELPLDIRPGVPDDELFRPMTEVELLAATLQADGVEEADSPFLVSDPESMTSRREHAVQSSREALALDPDNLLAARMWIEARALEGLPIEPEPIAVVEQHAQRDDLAPVERLHLAECFHHLGDGERARGMFEPVEREFPDRPELERVRKMLDGEAE